MHMFLLVSMYHQIFCGGAITALWFVKHVLCTQWWWTATVFNSAGPGPEVRVLSRLWPHDFPAGEGFVQQEDRTLPFLASQVRPSLAEITKYWACAVCFLFFFVCFLTDEHISIAGQKSTWHLWVCVSVWFWRPTAGETFGTSSS